MAGPVHLNQQQLTVGRNQEMFLFFINHDLLTIIHCVILFFCFILFDIYQYTLYMCPLH